MYDYRFLSRDNALALLPFPESFLPDLDEALQAINSGQNGGKNRCIEELVRLNKKTKKRNRGKGSHGILMLILLSSTYTTGLKSPLINTISSHPLMRTVTAHHNRRCCEFIFGGVLVLNRIFPRVNRALLVRAFGHAVRYPFLFNVS